jgi:FtsH-binding integral membrane protein
MEPNFFDNNVKTFESSVSSYMTRVYQWMMVGILITAVVSLLVSSDQSLMMSLVTGPMKWGLFIAQLGLVFVLSGMINRLSVPVATGLFLFYSALTGASLSVLVYAYTMSSIQSAFFTTSVGFLGLTLFGYTTKKDLSAVGTFCMMGLFGVVAISLISIFFPGLRNGTFGLILDFVILLVFAGLTAYDTQRIKAMGQMAQSNDMRSKMAILGALSLYLNFINLFITILNLTGDRRR